MVVLIIRFGPAPQLGSGFTDHKLMEISGEEFKDLNVRLFALGVWQKISSAGYGHLLVGRTSQITPNNDITPDYKPLYAVFRISSENGVVTDYTIDYGGPQVKIEALTS